MEEEPSTLWTALQTRYEQQKVMILPEVNHDWTHLGLEDYKSIGYYNHVIHKICTKLCFVKNNLPKSIRLKRHFKLCSLWIGSYNINMYIGINKMT
jgi:hypothetical protein